MDWWIGGAVGELIESRWHVNAAFKAMYRSACPGDRHAETAIQALDKAIACLEAAQRELEAE